MGFWRKMPREARLVGDLTLGETYQGDPDRGTKPWPWPFIIFKLSKDQGVQV